MTEQPGSSNATSLGRTNSDLNASAPPFEFRPTPNTPAAAAPAAPVRSYASVVARDNTERSRDSVRGSRARNAGPARNSTASPSSTASRPHSAAPRRNPSGSSLSFNFNPNALPFVVRSPSAPETPQANSGASPSVASSESPAVIPEEPQPEDGKHASAEIASDESQHHASLTPDSVDGKPKAPSTNGFHTTEAAVNGLHHPPPARANPQDSSGAASDTEPAVADAPVEDAKAAGAKASQALAPESGAATARGIDVDEQSDTAHDLPHISPLARSVEHMRQLVPPMDTAPATPPDNASNAAPHSPQAGAADPRCDNSATAASAADDAHSGERTWPPHANGVARAGRPTSSATEQSLEGVTGTLSAICGGLHSTLGDSGSGVLGGAMSSSLTPRALSQPMQQHERSVNRLRTVVHHEIVRALQRLTALPLAGNEQRDNGSSGGARGEISLEGGVASGDANHAGGGSAQLERAACMDHFVARAHADSITAHTHSAFQKLDDRTADPEAVACNYCRAVMVDVLAVAASWRSWIAPYCTSMSAHDTLATQHSRCTDVLTAAMPAVPGLSEWYANICTRRDDPFKDEEDPAANGGAASPAQVAEGVVVAGPEVHGLPGVQVKRVGAAPWVAEAACEGNFEAQVRVAALRMLRSAMGSGEGLVVVAREFRAESGRETGLGGSSTQRHGVARTASGYSGGSFEQRGSRVLGAVVGGQDDDDGLDGGMDGDGGADSDDGEALDDQGEEREGGGQDDGDDGPQSRLSWGTSQELGVSGGSTAAPAAGRRGYIARTRSSGGSARRPRPRQPRVCLSPSAVPPANISFATLVSPEATPRGRRPWFRTGGALAVSKQQTLGVLEPVHPKLRQVVIQEPGVSLGSALPNEAQQHLTLTQQDGSEPLWRAGVHNAEVAQRGLPTVSILDSRVAYVHCIIGPAAAVAGLSTSLDAPLAPAASAAAAAPTTVPPANTFLATASSASDPTNDTVDAPATFVLARSLTGVLINGHRIDHGVRVRLRDGDTLTMVPHTSSGPALSYQFRAGDPSARLVPPHASVAASLPPLHSIPLCQICGGLPRECLELQPCGHTFCAACLSHKFAHLLTTASHLACPHGCLQPESINQCPEVDALVAALPEYLTRLSRVLDWRSGRLDSENGEAAPMPPSSPRSPNWAGRSIGARSGASCGADASLADQAGGSTLSTFERFVESLGPDAWQHTPRGRAGRAGATRHDERVTVDAAAETGGGERSGELRPPFATATPAFIPEHTGRPAAISELVPLSRDMLPLSMQELQAQQSDVSANVVKSAAECGCETKELGVVIRHLYILMHAAMMSSLWKEELNRAGTVEDSAAAARAVVQAAHSGRTAAEELGGEHGQELLCAAATMICALVLTQQPGMEEVCQGNQWRAARANVVEVLVEALEVWPQSNAVAHACLQCLVALCKDNAMMKANVTVAALKPVIRVLQEGGARYAIAERGFTLLAVLQAGGDHLNDGVRRLLAEAGLQGAAVKALRVHAAGDERALTAVCFAIAMILRGGEKWRESVKWAAARSTLLSSITCAERSYRFRCRAMRVPPDDALSALLAFLVLYLEPVQKSIKGRRKLMQTWAAVGVGTLAFATVLAGIKRHPHFRAT
eukprot:jgi/Ulvmu1/6989/UM033_0047.1